MTLLRLEDVHFAYGTHEALSGVSLDLEAGERVALVGPNGAGKSTLLRVASGYLAPTRGRVLLGNDDLARLPRRVAARRLAGVAAEEAHDFPFRVRESVALGRHAWRAAFGPPSDEDVRHVEVALKVLALEDLQERTLPSLSTGERQRASVARALAQDAEVLLLDEPTAHLDLGHQLRVLAAVAALGVSPRSAVIAAIHDVNLAAGWATRVVFMAFGKVVAQGKPEDVLTAERLASFYDTPMHALPHPEGGPPVIVPGRTS